MKKVILVLIVMAMPLVAQQLPQRPPVTIDDLKMQIADCTISGRAQTLYEAKLIVRIKQLEDELAEAKAGQ